MQISCLVSFTSLCVIFFHNRDWIKDELTNEWKVDMKKSLIDFHTSS